MHLLHAVCYSPCRHPHYFQVISALLAFQIDGDFSHFFFSVIDGHSGWSCSHALAWIVLDYMAAAFLDVDQLRAVQRSLTDPLVVGHVVCQPQMLDCNGKPVTNFLANQAPPLDVHEFLLQRLGVYIEELLRRSEDRTRNRESLFSVF